MAKFSFYCPKCNHYQERAVDQEIRVFKNEKDELISNPVLFECENEKCYQTFGFDLW